MTDGIIQKAFKPYIDNWSFDAHSQVIQREFIKLQQELIEKIKQIGHYKESNFDCSCMVCFALEEIIGDRIE